MNRLKIRKMDSKTKHNLLGSYCSAIGLFNANGLSYGVAETIRCLKELSSLLTRAQRVRDELTDDDIAGMQLKEVSVEDLLPRQEIKVDIFSAGDHIDVTAVSKGKGFQGTIKRLGQHRGPMKHGSKFHRHAGSNGTSSDPSRVYKGKGMPGQMGNKRVTIQNLEIVRVDAENNLILVKGAVPGPKKGLVNVKATVKNKK